MPGNKEKLQATSGKQEAPPGFRSPDHPITEPALRVAKGSPDPVNLVRVTFLPANRTVEFELDQLPYAEHGKEHSILDVALNFELDLDHACGGACACTTCHVVVKKGEELLSAMEDDEADKLDTAADLTLHSRLGCQAQIVRPGEIVVEIPSWNRNFARE
jgi:2Fe-2S ferredoxin